MIKEQKLKLFFLVKKSLPSVKNYNHNNSHHNKNKSSAETNKSTPSTILFKSFPKINAYNLITKNLKSKHNSFPKQYIQILIENFVQSKYCHNNAMFKEIIYFNYDEEFLKRFYKTTESYERIPKFVQYYKNYLKFFCLPTLCELKLNDIIQGYGEKHAQIFYNENYKDNEINNENEISSNKENYLFEMFTGSIRNSISLFAKNDNEDKTMYFDGNSLSFKNEILLTQSNTIKSILFRLENKPIKHINNLQQKKTIKFSKIIHPNINSNLFKTHLLCHTHSLLKRDKVNVTEQNKSQSKIKLNNNIQHRSRNINKLNVILKPPFATLKNKQIPFFHTKNTFSTHMPKNNSKQKPQNNKRNKSLSINTNKPLIIKYSQETKSIPKTTNLNLKTISNNKQNKSTRIKTEHKMSINFNLIDYFNKADDISKTYRNNNSKKYSRNLKVNNNGNTKYIYNTTQIKHKGKSLKNKKLCDL
jgi:hypothetical protein